MLWFPNRILSAGAARSGRALERHEDTPNCMRILFSARSSVAILISCGKIAFGAKDKSPQFTAGTLLTHLTLPDDVLEAIRRCEGAVLAQSHTTTILPAPREESISLPSLGSFSTCTQIFGKDEQQKQEPAADQFFTSLPGPRSPSTRMPSPDRGISTRKTDPSPTLLVTEILPS